MATQSWSTRVRHETDAQFREWGSEFSGKMAAVGLIQTADTGQINWTTVVRPGTNTNAGYEIWRFDDAPQGTAPIFLRVEYGTSGGPTQPRIQMQFGTGSNGSGTLTGQTSISRLIHASFTATVDTARQSYMSAGDGWFAVFWKQGSADGLFHVSRTVDASGASSAVGAIVYWGSGQTSGITATQAYDFPRATTYAAQTGIAGAALCFNPQLATSTALSGDIAAFVCWTPAPQMTPVLGVCGVLATEITGGNTFNATLVGSTPRTYLAMPDQAGPISPISTGTSGGLRSCIRWD